MGTVRQEVITPQMSSTLVLTAGCALTTRSWKSSASTTWWSRLQSAPPTCCTTAALTCCSHTNTQSRTHTHPSLHTCRNTWTHSQTPSKHTRSKCTCWKYSTSLHHTNTHQINEQEHCPTCSLARFSSSSPVPAFLKTSLSNTFFLVPFFFLEEEKQAAFTKISLWLRSLLCAPLLFFFSFVLFLFNF